MKPVKLFWKLLRYRVAVMLILFMLLGASIHGSVADHPWQLLIGSIALAFSYVSATSSNDLADRKIDAINHPNSKGRPLVNGVAKPADMWALFFSTSVIAVALGIIVSLASSLILLVSILINVLYSLPPARFSFRTFLAPITLGVAYVGVPYLLALAVTKARFSSQDLIWLIGLYLLFIGRIILKDFRDRKGDAQYKKPTFLLRFGKPATCVLSLVCLLTGCSILIYAMLSVWTGLFIFAYLVAIASMLWRLYQSTDTNDEQLSIGVGARLGNGLLITVLAVEVLKSANSPATVQQIVVILLSVAFFGSFLIFLKNPGVAEIGYKG